MREQVRIKFGTDGIRGTAGIGALSVEAVLSLGKAVAAQFRDRDPRPRFVVGRDTRISSPMLEAAFCAGLAACGGDVWRAGVVPTPAVAFLTRVQGAAAGAVISASHNAFQDNGIKLFGPSGFKLSDATEAEIEARAQDSANQTGVTGPHVGRLSAEESGAALYLEHLTRVVGEGSPLQGLKLVVDAGHGAASHLAAPLFRNLGAEVIAIGDAPDGLNINDGVGALHADALCDVVTAAGADLGVALDGDADRAIFVDEQGRVRNGDDCLGLLAVHLRADGRLKQPTVVATQMSNLGLERFLENRGIGLIRTAVGDRHVLEALRSGGLVLGGEQSGHIILLDRSTTGDGLLTALEVCRILRETRTPFSELLDGFEVFPQVLVNVRVQSRKPIESLPTVRRVIEEVEGRLGTEGRVLVRFSGTEPLARVMVEGRCRETVVGLAQRIAREIEEQLG